MSIAAPEPVPGWCESFSPAFAELPNTRPAWGTPDINTAGHENDSWDGMAIGWWGGEP
ncbi:MAG: hypothetical protein ACTH31_06655 [Pseudoclavibacter sp.]